VLRVEAVTGETGYAPHVLQNNLLAVQTEGHGQTCGATIGGCCLRHEADALTQASHPFSTTNATSSVRSDAKNSHVARRIHADSSCSGSDAEPGVRSAARNARTRNGPPASGDSSSHAAAYGLACAASASLAAMSRGSDRNAGPGRIAGSTPPIFSPAGIGPPRKRSEASPSGVSRTRT